jgi:hypothetical protein
MWHSSFLIFLRNFGTDCIVTTVNCGLQQVFLLLEGEKTGTGTECIFIRFLFNGTLLKGGE